jgi:hypothetical protein
MRSVSKKQYDIAGSCVRITLCALMWWSCLGAVDRAVARPPLRAWSGVMSIADGEPLTLIRRDRLWTARAGATLMDGDIVETGAGAFVVAEMNDGSLLGIGPGSSIYILHNDIPTVVVLKGWVKADDRNSKSGTSIRVTGTRAGIQIQKAAVILEADERQDVIFDEQGSATLLLRDDTATHVDKETQPGQFFLREPHQSVTMQSRPSSEFVSQMPVAFRDSLPANASSRLKALTEPAAVRDVNYVDVQRYLTMPRDWRGDFIGRFRGRLRDPAFRSALDSHMTQHPEWQPILHPPPPPDEDPAATPMKPHPDSSTPSAINKAK